LILRLLVAYIYRKTIGSFHLSWLLVVYIYFKTISSLHLSLVFVNMSFISHRWCYTELLGDRGLGLRSGPNQSVYWTDTELGNSKTSRAWKKKNKSEKETGGVL